MFLVFLKITAWSKVQFIGGSENLKTLTLMNSFFLLLLNRCMDYSQRLLWWKMKNAISHLIHVQNMMLLLIVCLIIFPEDKVFKDLMQAITLTVTIVKVKIFSHSTSQPAIEDVSDFRNMQAHDQFFEAQPITTSRYVLLKETNQPSN